jgi:hypothetical protein
MPATLPMTRRQAAQRWRAAVIGLFAVVGVTAGIALASSSGSGDKAPGAAPPPTPTAGAPSGLPQREVAVQPQLAASQKK